jgi:hypothetical protein
MPPIFSTGGSSFKSSSSSRWIRRERGGGGGRGRRGGEKGEGGERRGEKRGEGVRECLRHRPGVGDEVLADGDADPYAAVVAEDADADAYVLRRRHPEHHVAYLCTRYLQQVHGPWHVRNHRGHAVVEPQGRHVLHLVRHPADGLQRLVHHVGIGALLEHSGAVLYDAHPLGGVLHAHRQLDVAEPEVVA